MTEEKKALLQIDPRGVGHIAINSSFPRYWFQWGEYIVIEPVPDAVYSLLLYIPDWPTVGLSVTPNVPVDLPPEFHPCVVDFACYVLAMKLGRWGLATQYYNTYIRNMKKRYIDYIRRKTERREIHEIPDNVKYEGGQTWGH